MKNDIVVKNVSALIRAYDPERAEALIKNPVDFLASPAPYSAAAELLYQALYEDAKKAGTPLQAMKNIYKAGAEYRTSLAGVFPSEGYTCACSSFHLARVRGDFSALPSAEGMPVEKLFPPVDQRGENIELPSEADLKYFISAQGYKRRGKEKQIYIFPDGTTVNAFYLLDILQALGEGVSARTRPGDYSAIYFQSPSGDGILMKVKR